MSELLVVREMTKRYGQVTVLRGVSMTLRGGEIHALLGANGAGKSTLCKLIAGLTDVTSGSMQIAGHSYSYSPANKQAAEAAGIQIIQQELNLIPTLNVAENLFLNRLPSVAGFLRIKSLHRQAKVALGRLGLEEIDTHTLVSELGVGRQQMVEIAAALACDCKVLILDEPTAALSGTESELLFGQLNELRQRGVGMIYISHRLDEVKQIADRVTVLRDGQHVCTRDAAEISTDDMVDLMSGDGGASARSIGNSQQVSPPSTVGQGNSDQTPVLVVDSICCGMVDDVSFAVEAGEKFGIAGLVGSGRTELLRTIFGADPASRGSITVAGRKPRQFRHPAAAVAAGLALVTEDRKLNGLLLEQSIRSNTSLSAMMKRFSAWGVIREEAEATVTQTMCDLMDTQCTSIEQVVGTLSGGNQQKVAIAKWLTRDADVFLFDEPTRGIDVGARRRIYQLFDELASKGKGIVMVSSDLDELFETCDRIAVMSAGRMVQIFKRGNWSEDAILHASFAGHRQKNGHRQETAVR